jgi:hypothetical protein
VNVPLRFLTLTLVDAHCLCAVVRICSLKNYEKGVMSSHIHHLKVGDKLSMKGPFPKLAYTANMKKSIGMVAGGTGQSNDESAEGRGPTASTNRAHSLG